MKVENQVCTLEQAKKLKELGISQQGYFMYSHSGEIKSMLIKAMHHVPFKYSTGILDVIGLDNSDNECIAFTVAELGAMLHTGANLCTMVADGKWQAQYEHTTIDQRERNYGTGTTIYSTRHTTEAEARASMLIYLLENNIITAESVNKRLK